MRSAKYIRDSYARIGKELERSTERKSPVTPRKHRDPTTDLAKLVLSYEPKDLRLDLNYMSSHAVLDTSSLWAKDVVEGARLREVSRSPGEGRLVVALDAHSNMAEFERYNSVVRDHNERWESEGCPEDSFDPWSGDVSPVEGFVDPAHADEGIPNLGDADGPLHRVRPSARRSRLLTVEYRVAEGGSGWGIEFVASDRKGRAVCWDSMSGPDLAALVRRSVQMLYGNHEVVGNEGQLSEGLAMLVQGRKVALCRRLSTLPAWARGGAKDVNPDLVVAKFEEGAMYAVHGAAGYLVPVMCVVGMFVWAAVCLMHTWPAPPHSYTQGPLAGFWPFAIGEAALSFVAWLSAAAGTRAKRGAEASKMRQSFL